MSRTIRKWPWHYFRHPKGAKQAKINEARPGSIPPDSYDDVHFSQEAWKCKDRDRKKQ